MMKNILIIDDDPSITSILTFVFSQIGYKTVSAKSETDSIIHLESETLFEFIFLDIDSNEPSELTLAEKIISKSPNLNTIVMTGYNSADFAKKIYKLNPVGIIYKPFDMDEVLSYIYRKKAGTYEAK
jgi:DNA-binding NtrC family response regulator